VSLIAFQNSRCCPNRVSSRPIGLFYALIWCRSPHDHLLPSRHGQISWSIVTEKSTSKIVLASIDCQLRFKSHVCSLSGRLCHLALCSVSSFWVFLTTVSYGSLCPRHELNPTPYFRWSLNGSSLFYLALSSWSLYIDSRMHDILERHSASLFSYRLRKLHRWYSTRIPKSNNNTVANHTKHQTPQNDYGASLP